MPEIQHKDFTAINLLDGDNLTVTWDVGRRCNFDCSYCPTHRHDNFSKHADLETLKKTGKFVFDYANLIMPHKKTKRMNINFTGGSQQLILTLHLLDIGYVIHTNSIIKMIT